MLEAAVQSNLEMQALDVPLGVNASNAANYCRVAGLSGLV